MTSYTVILIIVFIESWLLSFSNIMFGLIFYTTWIHCASFSRLGIGYCKALCVIERINCLACNRIIVLMHNYVTGLFRVNQFVMQKRLQGWILQCAKSKNNTDLCIDIQCITFQRLQNECVVSELENVCFLTETLHGYPVLTKSFNFNFNCQDKSLYCIRPSVISPWLGHFWTDLFQSRF